MALINCSECGNEISNLAASCPHCGSPNLNNKIDKARFNKKSKILMPVVTLILVIVCVILLLVNRKSPLEKIVFDNFQTLKVEIDDDIKLKDALYFKRTTKDGDEWYQVLLIYTYRGITCYAGFNDNGEYLGNGNEYVNEDNPDMDVAWSNYIVSIMIIEYEQYASGAKYIMYSESDFEPVVKEDKMYEVEHCVVAVSLDKIK